MEQGVSVMTSKVSLERFTYNLGVLAGLMDSDGFDSEMSKAEAFKYWLGLVKRLREAGFFKHARRISHL